ncbi:uncharacterized protein LOC105168709 [Sesamum indicum]|uniref:Uncharacterized protein LOC105168709 n=1 Tax=Sesamum indicum TaxID=4182 RepID=A0A6I9TR12_SESIN|nr:uncharacterized protein LOC105168709 [Sesamum indicum]
MMEGTAGEGSSRRSCKLERKTIEKNRRILMKTLCFKLVSLIPDHHFKPPKELLSQQDQLEQATTYIKLLAARVEEMKRRKTQAVMTSTTANPTRSSKNNAGFMGRSKPPVVKIRELGSNLEVVLISGLCKTVMLHQVISIIEQEGAEVVNVNLSNIAGQIFHTIHAQVKVSRVGVDSTRIRVRIQELIS